MEKKKKENVWLKFPFVEFAVDLKQSVIPQGQRTLQGFFSPVSKQVKKAPPPQIG